MMKQLILIALLAWPLAAQQVTNLYAAGVSYNAGGSPKIAGSALYARAVNDAGTYLFSVFDALPTTRAPYTVTTQIGAGIAQRLLTIGNVPIYAPTAAGISWNGQNTGWAWTTGAMASIKVRGPWCIMPNLRVLKTSVGGGAGYMPIVGVMVGWEQ